MQTFLAEVDAFMAATGASEATAGIELANHGHFVRRCRAGCDVSCRVIDRARERMAALLAQNWRPNPQGRPRGRPPGSRNKPAQPAQQGSA
jgi:hypothetical protein